MNTALTFSDWDALDAVDAAFKFQFGIWRVALDHENDFFVAARIVSGLAN